LYFERFRFAARRFVVLVGGGMGWIESKLQARSGKERLRIKTMND
jgi:hypothetical protein